MRPEGMRKNPHKDDAAKGQQQKAFKMSQFLAYEAGADAYEEVLKKGGVFTYGHHTPDIELSNAPEVSGYWVFIEDNDVT